MHDGLSMHQTKHCEQGWIQGGDRPNRPPPLKPMKVTLLTMILYNSEKSIRDIKPFCRPLFCHNHVVKYTTVHLSYRNDPVMRLDYIKYH